MAERRRWKVRHDFVRDPSAIAGAAILWNLLAALFAPLVAPYTPMT